MEILGLYSDLALVALAVVAVLSVIASLTKGRADDKMVDVLLSFLRRLFLTKKVLPLLLLIPLASCARVQIETQSLAPDGETVEVCKASHMSAFKNFQDVQMKACHAEGGAGQATTDPLASAIADAILQRVTGGATP